MISCATRRARVVQVLFSAQYKSRLLLFYDDWGRLWYLSYWMFLWVSHWPPTASWLVLCRTQRQVTTYGPWADRYCNTHPSVQSRPGHRTAQTEHPLSPTVNKINLIRLNLTNGTFFQQFFLWPAITIPLVLVPYGETDKEETAMICLGKGRYLPIQCLHRKQQYLL